MAIRRRTGLTLVIIAAALLVALLFLIPVLFNLDRYRPEVISFLQAETGKQIEIGHVAALTLFPTVSIRIDDFGLKNPAIFPAGYVIKARRIDATLDAWGATPPAIRHQVAGAGRPSHQSGFAP